MGVPPPGENDGGGDSSCSVRDIENSTTFIIAKQITSKYVKIQTNCSFKTSWANLVVKAFIVQVLNRNIKLVLHIFENFQFEWTYNFKTNKKLEFFTNIVKHGNWQVEIAYM